MFGRVRVVEYNAPQYTVDNDFKLLVGSWPVSFDLDPDLDRLSQLYVAITSPLGERYCMYIHTYSAGEMVRPRDGNNIKIYVGLTLKVYKKKHQYISTFSHQSRCPYVASNVAKWRFPPRNISPATLENSWDNFRIHCTARVKRRW